MQYDYIHYNHIGHYHCECGFKRENPTYEVSTFEASPFLNMTINNFTFNMKIAGDFNAFNAIAAYAVLKELGLNDASIQKVLKHILQIMDECSTFLKEIKKR